MQAKHVDRVIVSMEDLYVLFLNHVCHLVSEISERQNSRQVSNREGLILPLLGVPPRLDFHSMYARITFQMVIGVVQVLEDFLRQE
jgi:hypothetical protein